jgi:serine/threonine protein kinase
LIGRVRQALGDSYTVITAVGRGGNATLFGAFDAKGEKVAIKVLHAELAVSVAADRFLREIRYASQLHHAHIAPLVDSGETDYLLWFVMPFVAGDTLRQVLRRERKLPIDRAVGIASESLEALGHAHEHGFAHRDMKPDNIVCAAPPRRRHAGGFRDRPRDRHLRRGPRHAQRLRGGLLVLFVACQPQSQRLLLLDLALIFALSAVGLTPERVPRTSGFASGAWPSWSTTGSGYRGSMCLGPCTPTAWGA